MKISAGLQTRAFDCARHGAYQARVITIAGREHPGHCPACVEEQRERQVTNRREDRQRALFARAEIPPRYRNRTFENYRVVHGKAGAVLRVCRDYAEHFDQRRQRGGGLILCGRPGTGKTHLAAAIARTVIEMHARSVWYTPVASAVRYVKQTYAPGSLASEADALRRFQRCDLLILDELGLQRGTEYEVTLLAEVLNERYSNVLPTMLITNHTHEELAQFIGPRAIDRMREGGGAVLALDWESYRPKVDKDEDLAWPDSTPTDHAGA